MTIPMNVLTMIDHAQANGGGTYRVFRSHRAQFTPVEFTAGYFVSMPNGVEHLPILPLELVLHVAQQIEEEMDYTNVFLGLWRDEDGLWSLDRTELVLSEKTALTLGKDWGQRAIWDIANGVAIPVWA